MSADITTPLDPMRFGCGCLHYLNGAIVPVKGCMAHDPEVPRGPAQPAPVAGETDATLRIDADAAWRRLVDRARSGGLAEADYHDVSAMRVGVEVVAAALRRARAERDALKERMRKLPDCTHCGGAGGFGPGGFSPTDGEWQGEFCEHCGGSGKETAEARAEKAEGALARQVEAAYLEAVQDTANTLTGDSIAETWALDLWEESEARTLLAPRPAPTTAERVWVGWPEYGILRTVTTSERSGATGYLRADLAARQAADARREALEEAVKLVDEENADQGDLEMLRNLARDIRALAPPEGQPPQGANHA